MDITALSGPENSGKTSTFEKVYDALKGDTWHFKLKKDKHFYKKEVTSGITEVITPRSLDFVAIFEEISTSKIIGISSYGDDRNTVELALSQLKRENCDMVFLACRTKGGSKNVITEFDLSPTILLKTIYHHSNNTQQDCCNIMDAEEILMQLMSRI